MKELTNIRNAISKMNPQDSQAIKGGLNTIPGETLDVETEVDDITGDVTLSLLMDGEVFFSAPIA